MLNTFDAAARVKGGGSYPDIDGVVQFLGVDNGSWVEAVFQGLPQYRSAAENNPQIGPFGFHIHENGECGNREGSDPFSAAGAHWNPDNKPHGNHAGDFPVLFSERDGTARLSFFTDRFSPSDVIGKTIVLHQSPDDYKTQPSGNSGVRIACGEIVSFAMFD